MLTAILAVRNLLGEKHDLWDVNTERSYYEEFSRPTSASPMCHHRTARPSTTFPAAAAVPLAAGA